MVKTQDILGMNARNLLYVDIYNTGKGKKIADHKLLTKSALITAKLSTPKLYGVFRKYEDINKYDFIKKLPESFVLKPDNSLGGEGIVVIEKRGKYAGEWLTTTGDIKNTDDLKLLIQDILEGRFSMDNAPDIAFLEERVRIHPAFARICYQGTPDIGVLVFNKVPVMTFLRLPTKESGGRANMFQGAIACGIDIATGITTNAVRWTSAIKYFPETKRRLIGVRIPVWDDVLRLAINCQIAIPELGFMRADVVLQPSLLEPGKTIPKILELNAQPGLKIQLANRVGLRKRLERIEGLTVEDAEAGIRIAKALFADPRYLGVPVGKQIVDVHETVLVRSFNGERVPVRVKVDTGAYNTSIDIELAKQLGLLKEENIVREQQFRSALGVDTRPVVDFIFWLRGVKIKTIASVSDRTGLKRQMLVGRKDLKGFLVNPE